MRRSGAARRPPAWAVPAGERTGGCARRWGVEQASRTRASVRTARAGACVERRGPSWAYVHHAGAPRRARERRGAVDAPAERLGQGGYVQAGRRVGRRCATREAAGGHHLERRTARVAPEPGHGYSQPLSVCRARAGRGVGGAFRPKPGGGRTAQRGRPNAASAGSARQRRRRTRSTGGRCRVAPTQRRSGAAWGETTRGGRGGYRAAHTAARCEPAAAVTRTLAHRRQGDRRPRERAPVA